MNYIVLGFFFVLLTGRFLSETVRLIPKAFDLVDLVFIPLLAAGALFAGSLGGVDRPLHKKLLRWTVLIALLAVVSGLANYERTHFAPVLLYVFGICGGPALYLALNRLIRKKEKLAIQISRFLFLMFIVEGAVVLLVSLPMFFATGNPDYVSGTFGRNSYQFSALLAIIGGYFLGKMRYGNARSVVGIAIQAAIVLTFLFLQYRTATPAFFASYIVCIGLLYGRKVVKMILAAGAMAAIGYFAFQFVGAGAADLKFDDILLLADDPAMATDFGKVIAYGNTFTMFGDMPVTMVTGAGPGTMVSRSAYTFIVEPMVTTQKGVGAFVTSMFPNHSFHTDVFREYVEPLFALEAVFGSDQANNPASSILAALAEIGFPGLFLLAMVYGTMMRRVIADAQFAVKTRDPELIALASALVCGSTYLCLLSPLDNYLEIARVTLPVWLLFWTVSSMVYRRKREKVVAALEAMHAQDQASSRPTIADVAA